MKSVLATRLTKLRKKLNKSQYDVARELNLPQSTYAGYEVGRSEPNNETLINLSDYFKVSTDYLLGKTDIKATQAEVDFLNEIKNKSIDQLIKDYNLTLGDEALDPKEERILIKLMKSFMEGDE